MKIKFYILWFENEPSWVDGKIEDIKEIVEDNGFEWVEPVICKKESEFKENFNDFDIILIDFRLVDGKTAQTGGDVINTIRTTDCFTNIIFYSQEGEEVLRREIANKRLDGVYCINRADFIDRFEKIFLTNIKKVEDVNNLRGLVMAETADLEHMKEKIIELYDDASCPKKTEITEKILNEMTDSATKHKTFLDSKDKHTTFKELLSKFDFYKKSIIVHKINKRSTPIAKFIHSKFNEEIIVKRNLLAHVEEKTKSSGEIYLESEKIGNHRLEFTHNEAKKIRKDISRYRIELQKIINSF
jgi:hypothetical protein